MRTALLALALAACSSAPVAPPHTTATSSGGTIAPPPLRPPIDAPAPADGPPDPLAARPGPVPGTPYVVRTAADATYCTGVHAWLEDPSGAAPTDAFGRAMLADLKGPTTAATLRPIVREFTDAQRELAATVDLPSIAHLVELLRWMAVFVAQGAPPAQLAHDEVNRYCELLVEQAQALVKRADELAARCRELATSAAPGWWNDACR